jgi:phosphatidate cytidylyltransferase
MNLLKRILVGIIAIPLILYIFYLGGIGLASLLALIVFIQMHELREMFLLKRIEIPLIVLPLSILVFITSSFCEFYQVLASLLLIFIIVFGNDLFRNRLEGAIHRISVTIFSLIYTSIFLSSIYRLRLKTDGAYLIVSLMILIWITDTFAYFIGKFLGRKRNIFKASPKKSLEGFFGGFLACLVGAYFISVFIHFSLIHTLSLAISAGIFGQLGDLFESLLKRDIGVKDSSSIIPGHGGVLDRFDSLMIAAPVLYVILNFLGK